MKPRQQFLPGFALGIVMLGMGLITPCSNFGLFSPNSLAPATPTAAVVPTLVPVPMKIKAFQATKEIDTIEVPAGSSATFALAIEPWRGKTNFLWSVEGLPSGIAAHWIVFPTPNRRNLIVAVPGSFPPGNYPLSVQAISTKESSEAGQWSTPFTVKVIPCQESVQTGVFTLTSANAVAFEPYGISSSSLGLGSPVMQFCETDTPRTLLVSVNSATSDTGSSVSEPHVGFGLFYAFEYPVDRDTILRTETYPNAEQVGVSENGILRWPIAPGLYRLFFFQGRLMTTPVYGGLSPRLTITYRLEINPSPK